jgi:predicted nucleic acid-binding protein
VIVVDTSAVIGVLAGRPEAPGLADRVRGDGDLHAPHLLDVEFQHALRRLVVSGAISDDRAADARVDFADLTIVRYPHISLADRMWELRQNVTAYDAAFLALAETLGAPLITCDIRLSRVRGYTAAVELFRGAATSPPAERP